MIPQRSDRLGLKHAHSEVCQPSDIVLLILAIVLEHPYHCFLDADNWEALDVYF